MPNTSTNTSNITNMPDLKKLFVYVNFTDVDAQGGLTALKGQLKTSSETKYPERVFYVANDGSIITHGQEFGVSQEVRDQITDLQQESTNLQTTVKALTGLANVPATAGEVTISDTSVIGEYVKAQILKNKTIVAAKANSGITVEETADGAGTKTYTVGLDQSVIVDGKTIVTDGGKLKTDVKLVKKYCADETPSVNSTFYNVKTAAPAGTSVHPVILLTDNAGAILDIVDGNEFVTDGMLDSVSYDEANGILTFTWNGDSDKNSTPIDVKKLFQIESIHTGTPDYINVDKETPGKHGDAAKLAYHVDAKVDATDLTNLSTVTHNAKTDDTEENYVANLADDNAYTVATANVSGLVDAKKIAAKIRAIDVSIAGVGNDAIAREKTIADGIDKKIADLQKQLNDEVVNRGDADEALYGEAIPVSGPVNTIKKNADAIDILNGPDNKDGSVAQKIKALKESLHAEVEYTSAYNLVKVAVSQVAGVVVKKENAVTVKTGALTTGVDQDAEYTLAAPSDSGYTKAGGYKAKSIDQIAASDPALVTNQDAWIYGQCIKSQAVASIASDNNQYIKIVREDNKTKVAFEPWVEIHTIEELTKVGAETN